MAEDETPVAESLLPYEDWTREALRQVVLSAIRHVAVEGLPGAHHFYITFKTAFPGVIIPERLKTQYPDEMTIVLQHQFHSLSADAAHISVGLSFSGVPAVLTIPLAAITGFVDPSVRFGLSFDVTVPPPAETPEPPPDTTTDEKPAKTPDAPAEVVSLDAFRRKKE